MCSSKVSAVGGPATASQRAKSSCAISSLAFVVRQADPVDFEQLDVVVPAPLLYAFERRPTGSGTVGTIAPHAGTVGVPILLGDLNPRAPRSRDIPHDLR